MESTTISELIQSISTESILNAVLTIVGILCGLYIKNRDRREKIEKILENLRKAALDVVRSYEQTTVPETKAELGTERLTKPKAEEIKEKAVRAVIDMVDPAGSSVLAERLGLSEAKLSAMVDHLVESAVYGTKERPAA